MPRLQPSIAATVTLALTVAATLLLATLAWVGYNSHRSSQWDLFRTNHVLLADQLAISLTLPLWNFDRDVVGQVIEGAMQDHDVEGIVVQSVGNVPASLARIREVKFPGHWLVFRFRGRPPHSLEISRRIGCSAPNSPPPCGRFGA